MKLLMAPLNGQKEFAKYHFINLVSVVRNKNCVVQILKQKKASVQVTALSFFGLFEQENHLVLILACGVMLKSGSPNIMS